MTLEIDMETARKLHAAIAAVLNGLEIASAPVETRRPFSVPGVSDRKCRNQFAENAKRSAVVFSKMENTSKTEYQKIYMRITRTAKKLSKMLDIDPEMLDIQELEILSNKSNILLEKFNADIAMSNISSNKFGEMSNIFTEKSNAMSNILSNKKSNILSNMRGEGGCVFKNSSLNLTSNVSNINNESIHTYESLEVAKEQNFLKHTHLSEKIENENVRQNVRLKKSNTEKSNKSNIQNIKVNFEAFCAKYPVGRIGYESKAWKVWKTLDKAGELPEIHDMLALIEFCTKNRKTNSWNEIEPRYIPYANRWLADGAWKSALAEMREWNKEQKHLEKRRGELKARVLAKKTTETTNTANFSQSESKDTRDFFKGLETALKSKIAEQPQKPKTLITKENQQ
jgi:hypothetical protein